MSNPTGCTAGCYMMWLELLLHSYFCFLAFSLTHCEDPYWGLLSPVFCSTMYAIMYQVIDGELVKPFKAPDPAEMCEGRAKAFFKVSVAWKGVEKPSDASPTISRPVLHCCIQTCSRCSRWLIGSLSSNLIALRLGKERLTRKTNSSDGCAGKEGLGHLDLWQASILCLMDKQLSWRYLSAWLACFRLGFLL